MYKHKYTVTNQPQLITFGFLLVITTIVVVGNTIMMVYTREFDPLIFMLTVVNAAGLVLAITKVEDSIKYERKEIPDEELTPDQKLKNELKG